MDMMELRRRLMKIMAGGASLPSFMGKISGGTFVLEHDLRSNNYPAGSEYPSGTMTISHGLGEAPKGVIVYRLSGDVKNTSTEQYQIFSSYIYNATDTDSAWYDNSVSTYSRNGNRASCGTQSTSTFGINTVTDSSFKIKGSNSCPLKAGETYYWIAWTHGS